MGQKITFTAAGGSTEITLGDDSAGDFLRIDERDHVRSVDEEDLYGASAPFTGAGLNRRNNLGFSVEKLYGTTDLATAALADWPDSLPAYGTLKWIVGSTTRTMTDAALKRVRAVDWDGLAIKWSYSFTGSVFTTPV